MRVNLRRRFTVLLIAIVLIVSLDAVAFSTAAGGLASEESTLDSTIWPNTPVESAFDGSSNTATNAAVKNEASSSGLEQRLQEFALDDGWKNATRVDLMDKNGGDWTTTICSQGACGNCAETANGKEMNIGIRNPAAVYCEEMGYEYKTLKTENGEIGVCVLPNGEEYDAWAFYRGECGTEFSYCAKMGWPVAAEGTNDPFAATCTTCVLPDGSRRTVSELLDLSGSCTVGVATFNDTHPNEGDISGITERESSIPDNFDWRDVDGENWMTPVKNQGGCGSCWAFSAVGIVEPQYNILHGDPDLDLNLAEQYLVSDCCTSCGSCSGGGPATALRFVRDAGITDEDCFPYTASDCPCSDRCDDWSSRLKIIDETEYVPSDTQIIKENVIERGPLSVCMGIGGDFGGYFDGDIYRCTNDSGANHAVVVAGYNETEDYWIVKNSWGTGYQDGGYFKVGCGECSIENHVYYAALYTWPMPLSPANGLAIQPGEVTFHWHEQDEATGYHFQIDQVDTFDSPALIEADPYETEYTTNLSIGSYYWRVKAHLNGEDSPYSPAWRLTVVDEPVVQVTTDPGSDRDPAIAQTDDGKVWVVWWSHRSGNDDIWYKTTSDGGTTWSDASQITTDPGGDYDPAITQTDDGKVWVVWHSYHLGNYDIWYKTTSDGGTTWSDASQITTDPGSDHQPAIAQTDDGKVWVVWESYRSGNGDIWYNTSSDGGATWSGASQITTDPGGDYNPAIAQTDDGKVWVVWWSYRFGNCDIWYKTSSDGGATWSETSQITTDPGGDYQPAITQTDDGKVWVVWESHRSGNGDIWYNTSSDGGATWSDAFQFTQFIGHDYVPAATALSDGHLALAWDSDRAVNHDVWYGIIGSMEDIDPPPHLDWADNEPPNPDTEQTLTVRARVSDESGVQDVELMWWLDSTPQDKLSMYDDGDHDDYSAGDGVYGVQLGPFPIVGTVVEYQIELTDIDDNTIVAPQYPYSFQVLEPFVKTADILLVSDNLIMFAPYYTYYSDTLDTLGYAYDLWDSEMRGNLDADILNQYLDGIVIWAVPYWGYIGYLETLDSLTFYLDNGGKLFISGQAIGLIIGSSSFYQDYLHAEFVQDDTNLYGLFGVPGDPITDGLYVSISGGDGANNQSYPSEIDPIAPAVAIFTYDTPPPPTPTPTPTPPPPTPTPSPTPLSMTTATTHLAEPFVSEQEVIRGGSDEELPQWVSLARTGEETPPQGSSEEREAGTKGIVSSGSGALRVDTGTYKVVYFSFGFEAINSAEDRELVMDRVLDWLSGAGWSIPMTAETDTEGSNPYLEFGTHPSATDDYDSGIDVPHTPPIPGATFDAYFEIDDQLFPQLDKDYRAPADGIEWTLYVEANSDDITLTWDATDVPTDRCAYMDTGTELIDMKAATNTTLPAGQYSIPIVVGMETEITLKAGWNMVSVPVIPPDPSVDSVFPGAELVCGWDRENQMYIYSPAEVEPDQGYWVAVMGNTTVTVCGMPVYEWTGNITAGWNMIGSVIDDVLVTDWNDDLDGSVEPYTWWWNPTARAYDFFMLPATIEATKAYWIAATGNCTLTLPSPPIPTVGDEWVWSVVYEGETNERNERVTEVGADSYTIDVTFDEDLQREAFGLDLAIGSIARSMSKYTLDPAEEEVEITAPITTKATYTYEFDYPGPRWPIAVGKKWSFTLTVKTALGTDTFDRAVVVEGKEYVTVVAGTFSCFKLVTYEGSEVVKTEWYCQQVKSNVKVVDSATYASEEIWELVSYSVAP